MKKIEATIKPFKLDEVKDALSAIGIRGLTISEVKGFARQRGHGELYRRRKYLVDFMPKIKVEIVVSEEAVPQAIDTLPRASRTGRIGDDKIFVTPIDEAIRIRTGERGASAL
jgi:nitrogen regulatory protein PII